MTATAIKGFRRACFSTLIAVYFLIMVGGVVRSTGSGMGCPDWPKCFGSWTPPTSTDQLPSDYKEKFSAFREKKNQKFAKYLRLIGMNETADHIVYDKAVLSETEFNPVKAWIEYVNRLVGVTIGFFIIILFYKSISFRKSQSILFWISLLTLVLVIIQGWFGSIVVSTNLVTWTITVHFVLALLMVGFLIYLLNKSSEEKDIQTEISIRGLLIACMAVLLIQVYLGTEVRADVDVLLASVVSRENWIENLGNSFFIHRSFSWLVLIMNGIFFVQTRETIGLKTLSLAMFLLILLSVATGVGLAYLNMPAVVQPIHLTLATVTFGIQLSLFFKMSSKQKLVNE